MQNLTQIKSRQFHKYATIQPITRIAQNPIVQDEKVNSKHNSLMRSPNQNNFHLANVVRQILQMKPRTAQKLGSKQSSRNHKTQTIVQSKPSLQFFCNNAKRNERKLKEFNDNYEHLAHKTSLSKQKHRLNFIQIDNRLNSNKVATSKSSRTLKRQYYRNKIQSINNFDSLIEKKNQISVQQKVDPISNTEDTQSRIRITKRRTEVQIPKSKLSIKNIDKLIGMAPLRSQNRVKQLKYDLNLHKQSVNKEFQQDCEIVDLKISKERRTKKSITDFKVPEFIKISLEAYKQQPTYLLQQLEKRKLRQKSIENIENNNNQPQQLPEIRLQIAQKHYEELYIQDQNIMANKIRLLQKEKKKIINQVQPDVTIPLDSNIPSVASENKLQKRKPKLIKPKKYAQNQIIDICGWGQEDPNIPQTLFFKL